MIDLAANHLSRFINLSTNKMLRLSEMATNQQSRLIELTNLPVVIDQCSRLSELMTSQGLET
jgi:hypothetical protein